MLSPDKVPRFTVSSKRSRSRSRYGRARNTSSCASLLARVTKLAPKRYVPARTSRSRNCSCTSTSRYRWTELLGILVAATSCCSEAPEFVAPATSRSTMQVLRMARVPAIDWGLSLVDWRLRDFFTMGFHAPAKDVPACCRTLPELATLG